ncbi:MAG: hypothetical protein ACE5FN_11680, partial [Leptospirillia bacterium]
MKCFTHSVYRSARGWLPVALIVWLGATGCAMQSEMMELNTDMEDVQKLQARLEEGLGEATQATETVRALSIRLEELEKKTQLGTGSGLNARIASGLKEIDVELVRLKQERDSLERRMEEAESFFVERLQGVSGRQQGVESRVAALESNLGERDQNLDEWRQALNAEQEKRLQQAEARAADAETRAAAASGQLEQLKGQVTLLVDRLAELETRATEADRIAAQERENGLQLARADISALTDRLMELEQARQAEERLSEEDSAQLAARLASIEQQNIAALEERAAVRQKMDADNIAIADRLTELEKVREAQASLSDENIGKLTGQLASIQQRIEQQQDVAASEERAAVRQKMDADNIAIADRLTELEKVREAQASLSDENIGK